MSRILRLWRGELPLASAFWDWAVLGGIVVNGGTSILFYVLLMNDVPAFWLVLAYLAPLPYNALVVVGVWRAAERHPGDPRHATLAKAVTAAGMLLLSVT